MNQKGFLQRAIIIALVFLFMVGCSALATSTQVPIQQPSATTDYVLAPMDCVVSHSGWEGIVVAPGVVKPASGTVVAFECNGKDVEIANTTIVDGYIETKDFGKIGIRFGSQVQTVGAGEYMQLAEGITLPEQAIEIYILSSLLEDFTNRYSK
ncbi:MAG: hypothetical protein HY869_02240 [Chloroflexi bacterium]|nr:hypothetical protein [Chloroflexota bacterium]